MRPVLDRLPCFAALIVALALYTAAAQAAEKRVALLIGNAAYSNGLPPLANPPRDVRLLEASLSRLGFQVSAQVDLSQKALQRAVRDFGDKAQGADVAFFYFSGHGMQSRGENYLLPVGAQIDKESDLDIEAISAAAVLRQIEDAAPRAAVVVLDACRDNPVQVRTKSASKGLARMNAPSGTLVAYATSPGSTASDDGFYARYLADNLGKPGMELKEVFNETALAVEKASSGKQRPREDVGLRAKVYLTEGTQVASLKPEAVIPAAAPRLPAQPAASADPETQFWNEVKASGAREYYDAYLKQYPKGKYIALARIELKNLDERSKAQRADEAAEAQRAEQTAWEQAKSSGSAAAYSSYINSYPKGSYVALAQAAQQKAQRDGAEREKQEAAAERTRQETQRKADAEMKPGKVFKDCADCPEMLTIPAGSYQMGGTASDEQPVHNVSLKAFALGKTEVTQGQWKALMGNNPSHFAQCGDNCPVEQVSWDDAQAYISKLNQKTGKTYRLPSEAEWEYACRAGGRNEYCGSDSVDSVAWNNSNSGKRTHPAAGKQANAWGLYDMSGNVWEWTQDCWNDNYNGAPSDGSAWTTGQCFVGRVLRGGSCFNAPALARAAHRLRSVATFRDSVTGFRPARMLP
ncbi:SUMF1/EgtB/PvdO family nonheme iron enzyme [Propionivibrio sp.]|uniref:SUMF1/EgtB/PvdO family nonheme iron enzyme n=1 Tax=Propionivibrio sp. TaxID=2212460 RepID=UPI003BF2A3AB